MNSGTKPECEEIVRGCLRRIMDPCSVATGYPLHLVEMGLVKSVNIDTKKNIAEIDLRLTSPSCMMVGFFATEIEDLVTEAIPEIDDVKITFDQGFDWTPKMMSREVRQARAKRFQQKFAKEIPSTNY